MASFFQTLSDVFSAFGAAVFVPVILFIIAKCMGVTGKKAFNTALLCAVGLTGFNLVINSYSAIIAPVVNQMVTNAGVNLPTLDTGWQSTSVIAYSTKVGLIFIGVAIILQLVLFFTKWTNVFMASDLWNNYSFMVWGSMLYALTDNMMLSMALMVVQLLYILLFSEACAKRWSTYYDYDNCCMTAPHHLESLPFAVFMNWFLGKIGFDKIKLNAQTLQKKLRHPRRAYVHRPGCRRSDRHHRQLQRSGRRGCADGLGYGILCSCFHRSDHGSIPEGSRYLRKRIYHSD